MAAVARISRRQVFPGHSLLLVFLTFVVFSLGCKESVQRRPYGWIKLGKLSKFEAAETYLPELRLVVWHDQKGYAVMSTQCTYDLGALERREEGGEVKYRSPYNDSIYGRHGQVLKGPAVANLPYYELRLDAGEYGSPEHPARRDTLFAYVGSEKPAEWRLAVPQ